MSVVYSSGLNICSVMAIKAMKRIVERRMKLEVTIFPKVIINDVIVHIHPMQLERYVTVGRQRRLLFWVLF